MSIHKTLISRANWYAIKYNIPVSVALAILTDGVAVATTYVVDTPSNIAHK